MEPWLDSLSDEWASNKQSSSPAISDAASRSRCSSRMSNDSKSRIPHLSRNFSQSSRQSSLLRPRSSKGLARISDSPVLAEQTSSKSNVAAQKASVNGRSIIPRKTSSAFSGSLNSIQHHTIQQGSGLRDEHTPEWKRRLARGEDVGGNGCDLFGPTRLEGVFKQPLPSSDGLESIPNSVVEHAKPWSMPERYQSMRTSKSRMQEMGVLAEQDEENSKCDSPVILSRNGSRSIKRKTLTGVVRDRVHSLEESNILMSRSEARQSSLRRDSRMRTFSGQEEIHNEMISPITMSAQNTIREQALKPLTEMAPTALHSRLESIAERPRSRSSDDGVHYGIQDNNREGVGELTSLSLPDDVSMGTQDFVSRGGFVNSRRGGRSLDGSFQKKRLSSSVPPSLEQSNLSFRNSPPPSVHASWTAEDVPDQVAGLQTTPQRPQDNDATGSRPRSSGSPLKLFGSHDTFTNARLLRRMSQFQHGSPKISIEDGIGPGNLDEENDQEINYFGKGDLDGCAFSQHIERQTLPSPSRRPSRRTIFNHPDSNDADDLQPKVSDDSLLQCREDNGPRGLSTGMEADGPKREASSPMKDRIPKRQRTSVQSKTGPTEEQRVGDALKPVADGSQMAGKKRKDARYDKAELVTDAAALASRQILKPKAARRAASTVVAGGGGEQTTRVEEAEAELDITEELADELASFGIGITEVANDSRKPSVTTQDFLNEATKIMQIIRQKGRPKSGLGSLEERAEKEVNPDSILDLNVEGEETTVDGFSRPPSRSGSIKKPKDREALRDPLVATHLQQYQDGDDLGLLLSSKLGSLHLASELHSEHAAPGSPPADHDQQRDGHESDPQNIRIRESEAHARKRKHSGSIAEDPISLPTHASSDTLTVNTIPTSSSASSGHKGRIPPGKVVVPNQVGAMTFDHSSKTWVRGTAPQLPRPSSRKSNSEDNPFGDIPDLSIDEQREAKRNAPAPEIEGLEQGNSHAEAMSLPELEEGPPPNVPYEMAKSVRKSSRVGSASASSAARPTSSITADLPSASACQTTHAQGDEISGDHDEEVEHEIRIHDGRVSEAPPSPQRLSKKARAVTVAFSSPLASTMAYHSDPSLLGLEHSIANDGFQDTVWSSSHHMSVNASGELDAAADRKQMPRLNRNHFQGRPVSRIDERDEDSMGYDLSIVHVSQVNAATPAQNSQLAQFPAHNKGLSMICLTPLSEFTLHQNDRPRHVEVSYVEERANPTSLRQAHGSLALAVDNLVKAITDVEPHELYWERVRRLNLSHKGLASLYRLEDYCSSVKELDVSANEIRHLSGVPLSVRTLIARENRLTKLTCWGHLQNLQYLDLSANGLERLDGLSCLVHLRELKANGNRIHNLEGVLDLDALLHLEVQGNEIGSVDFGSGGLKRLLHLDLRNNRLTSVRNVQTLPKLRTLYLERNRLRIFGSTDEPCTTLQDLRLSHNQIESIKLTNFPAIKVLHLDENRVRDIQGLDTALHLDTLSLREQSDSPNILNAVFSTSHECRKLYLSANRVPSEGLRLPCQPHDNLKYLELASCGLTFLHPNLGSNIPNCRTLNLNFNAIKDAGPLRGCRRLNKLLLSGNRLDRLRRSCKAVAALPAVKKLDLRDNPVTVGFYAPPREGRAVVHGEASAYVQDPYMLNTVAPSTDARWLGHLDKGTRAKRRLMELLLGDACVDLTELNGLTFDRAAVLPDDEVLRHLVNFGVVQTMPTCPKSLEPSDDDEVLSLDKRADGGRRKGEKGKGRRDRE